MDQYKYSPLTGDDIRLVRLLPGDPLMEIRIAIVHVELILQCPEPESVARLMTARELAQTLPPQWTAHETVEDEICFYYESADCESWAVSSLHPDSSINASRYRRGPQEDISVPQYEALSYTWMPNNPEEYALVTSESGTQAISSLRLGRNLACAMKCLRQQDEIRTLWIDAISIDQKNLKEREEQVARMAAIYKNASRVVIWLGASSDDSTLAIQKLSYLGDQVIYTKDNWLMPRPDAEEPFWCESACVVPYSVDAWTAINELLARPWFTRVWIVQEIQLARHGAVIQCGHDKVLWSRFRSAITCLWNKKVFPDGLSRERVKWIDYLTDTFYAHTPAHHLLHLVKGRKCCDPHDYVYGVLGLLPAALQANIVPSYEGTISETYTSFTISCIEQQKDLNILKDCGLEPRNEQLGLPSWVPDLSSTEMWTNPIKWHNAAGASKAAFEFVGQRLLRVAGVECGTVSFVEKGYGGDSDTRVRMILELVGLTEPKINPIWDEENDMRLEGFCKTIAGGYLQDRFPDYTLPSLQEWKAAVARPSYLQKLFTEPAHDSEFQFYERWVSGLLQKRVLFRTDSASIVLGPPGVKQGDVISVLLGCDSPLILRSTSNGRFVMVGECYVDELKDAAALFGPFPSYWHVQVDASPMDKQGTFRFLNSMTGEVRDEDPRVSDATKGFGRCDHNSAARHDHAQHGPTADFSLCLNRASHQLRYFTLE